MEVGRRWPEVFHIRVGRFTLQLLKNETGQQIWPNGVVSRPEYWTCVVNIPGGYFRITARRQDARKTS